MTFLFFSSLFAGPSVHYQNKESQEVSQWISTVVHGQGQRREPGGRPERALVREQAFSRPAGSRDRPAFIRGEDLELLSRELGVTAARLSKWREQFLGPARRSWKNAPGTPAMRRSPGCNKSWEKSPWLTSSSRRSSSTWRTAALYRGGGREDEPDRLALHPKTLLPGPGLPGVVLKRFTPYGQRRPGLARLR